MSVDKESSPIQDLDAHLDATRSRIRRKQELRCQNLASDTNRPEESFFKKLDSSLKKNTAFVKKLKGLTESQRDALVRDLGALNLSRFVAEMAAAVVEAKLKLTDVPTAVELCCLAHQRYAEFAPALLELWKGVFPRKKDDKIGNASKMRVDLRLFAELITVGVLAEKDALPVLGAALAYLLTTDKKEHVNLPIVSAFCRHCGEDYAALVPRSVRQAVDRAGQVMPTSTIFSAERRKHVADLVHDYYRSLVEHVMRLHSDMRKTERRNRRQYESKGEVFADAAHTLAEQRAAFDKLHQAAVAFAELVDADPPPVPADEPAEADDGLDDGMGIHVGTSFRADDGDGPWEDEDTRQFYEKLPELRVMLPGILFKESEKPTLQPLEEKVEEADDADETTDEVAETAAAEEDSAEAEPALSAAADDDAATAEPSVGSTNLKLLMDAFAAKMPTLVNRDMIDNAAVDFVTNLNTKTNRNRLTRSLFAVHRTRLDLLPFYSRLVAVLAPVMPDVGTELVQFLLTDFRRHVRFKNQLHLESKIKTMRFVGELVKFKVFPKSEALHCFKVLLFDFRHHNIDMACALLDACGYFLFHCADSHQKTKVLLEQMLRRKEAASGLDQRYTLTIDNAYFSCNPPSAAAVERVERPPLHSYLRRLLFRDLSKATWRKVTLQLRKLDWTSESATAAALRYLAASAQARFSSLQWLACVVAALMDKHDWIGYAVVDAVLEDIHVGMEANDPRLNQRRVAAVKYLGELYNYLVIDSSVIFKTLYSLISLGVSLEPSAPSPFDPPQHLFRIRLACVLLDTCGEFFSKGLSGRKLDCYLKYLQQYYWAKRDADCWNSERAPFPVDVTTLMSDTLEKLRPAVEPFKSLQEANDHVDAMRAELDEKIKEALVTSPFVESADAGAVEEEEFADRLRPIDEQDECDDETPTASQQSQGAADRLAGGAYDEEADEVHVHREDARGANQDDANFLASFERMVADSVQQRVLEAPRVAQADLVVPQHARSKMERRAKFEDSTDADATEPPEARPVVKFALLTKGRGNKPQLKALHVDVDSDLALSLHEQSAADREEKLKLKQLTLDISRRMEQEEISEAENAIRNVPQVLPARPAAEQKPKPFQHQKGAPFPKQIFQKSWQ